MDKWLNEPVTRGEVIGIVFIIVLPLVIYVGIAVESICKDYTDALSRLWRK